jgi:hypothetical protein
MALRKMEYRSEGKFVVGAPFPFLNLAGLIAIVAASAFLLLLLIPLPLVPPVLSIVSFAIACGAALYALFTKASFTKPRRDARGLSIWDIACVFTCIWLVAGVMTNRGYLLDWFDSLAIVP